MSNKNFEEQDKRIENILGNDYDYKEKSKLIKIYFNYLKENIELPCQLTWIEDFDWEEKYIFWDWDKEEYEELKKVNPSYTDTFEFLNFEILDDYYDEQICIKVKRISDNKKFIIELDYLEAKDKKSNNFQLLDDYSCWYVNHE
jgi:hypothetical protein